MTTTVYLDHNATTPLRPEAIQAVSEAMLMAGNGSSVHGPGRQVRSKIEAARGHVASLCGATSEMLTFTSGGTEANNLVLRGAKRSRVLVSATEHSSVREGCPDVIQVPVLPNGIIDLAKLEVLLNSNPEDTIVSVMLANNETGVIQPVAQIAALARQYGALVHCDGVQALGKIPVDVHELGVHFLTVSAHKLGGPAGCGALINVEGRELDPLICGGGQERRVRSGTENFIGIVGFGAAAQAVQKQGLGHMAVLAVWRDEMEDRLLAALPDLKIAGKGTNRLANTSLLIMPNILSETQIMALDLAGIAVSAGSACSSGKVKTSPILSAMGYGDDEALGGLRVTLGWTTVEDDIEKFESAWVDFCQRTKERRYAAMSAA